MSFRGRRSFNRARSPRGGQGFDRGPREMVRVVCSDCGKECEVPFRPTGDRPVYCSECFEKRGSPRTEDRRRSEYPREDRGRSEYPREDRERRSPPTSENVDLQILAELKRIRELLEKGQPKREAETMSHQVHDKESSG